MTRWLTLILLSAACTFPSFAQVEINPRRLQQWVQRGGDEEVVMTTFHRITRMGANGDKDSLVPVADMKLLADAGDDADLWIFGRTGHCAGDYADILYPKLGDWLAEKLGAGVSRP